MPKSKEKAKLPLVLLGVVLFSMAPRQAHAADESEVHGDAQVHADSKHASTRAEEDSYFNAPLYLGSATIGIGLATAGIGAALHVSEGNLSETSQLLYAIGGFTLLMGVYVLITGLGGHPAADMPDQAFVPYLSLDGGGLVLTGRF